MAFHLLSGDLFYEYVWIIEMQPDLKLVVSCVLMDCNRHKHVFLILGSGDVGSRELARRELLLVRHDLPLYSFFYSRVSVAERETCLVQFSTKREVRNKWHETRSVRKV